MKMTLRNSVFATAMVAGLSGSIAQAAATVIYSDTFAGTSGAVAGRSPDVTSSTAGGTSGAVWAGDAVASVNPDAVWTTSGGTNTTADSTYASVGSFSTGADANLITNSYLPFAPVAGYVYDFHLDVLPSSTGASGNWLAMAFAQTGLNGHGAGGGSSALSNDNPYGLILFSGNSTFQAFAGLGATNKQTTAGTASLAGASVANAFNSVDIILDTTGTNATLNWVVNGVTELATPYSYTGIPAIGNVVFGTNKITGAVANFSLTATPEPASIAVLALGGFAALRRRRAV